MRISLVFAVVALAWLALAIAETRIEVDENGDEYELKRFYIQGRQLTGNGSKSQCVVTRRKRSSRSAAGEGAVVVPGVTVSSQKVSLTSGALEHREGGSVLPQDEEEDQNKRRYVDVSQLQGVQLLDEDDEDELDEMDDEEEEYLEEDDDEDSNRKTKKDPFVPAALALPLAQSSSSATPLSQGVSVVASSASHSNVVGGEAGIVVVESHKPPKVNPDTHAVFELKPVQADDYEREEDDEEDEGADEDEGDYDYEQGEDLILYPQEPQEGDGDFVEEHISSMDVPSETVAYWSTGADEDVQPIIIQGKPGKPNKRPNQKPNNNGNKNKNKNNKNRRRPANQNQKRRPNQQQKKQKNQRRRPNKNRRPYNDNLLDYDQDMDGLDGNGNKNRKTNKNKNKKPATSSGSLNSSSISASNGSGSVSASVSSDNDGNSVMASASSTVQSRPTKKPKRKPSPVKRNKKKTKKKKTTNSALSNSNKRRRRPNGGSQTVGGYRRRRRPQQQQQQQVKRRRQQQQQQKRRRQQQQQRLRRRRNQNRRPQYFGDEPIVNCIYINKDPPTTTARPFWNILGRESGKEAGGNQEASAADPVAKEAVVQAMQRAGSEFGARKRTNLRFVA